MLQMWDELEWVQMREEDAQRHDKNTTGCYRLLQSSWRRDGADDLYHGCLLWGVLCLIGGCPAH